MKLAHPLIFASGLATLVLVVFWTSTTSRGQSPAQKSDSISPAKAREEVDLIVKDLREARAIASKIDDKKLREQMELALGQAELRARNLSEELAKAKPAGPAVLSSVEYDRLHAALKKEVFDKRRITFIENFATARPLTCQQAAGLLKCFDFDELRGKAATVLYPKLVNRQDFNEVLNTFTFETNKANVRRAVGLK